MAEAATEPEGSPMICATKVMRPGGARIGRIAGDLTLPRTVPLVTAVGVVGGAILVALLGFLFGGGFRPALYGAITGGFLGYVFTSYSPLRGESLATWLWLQLTGYTKRRRVDGKVVTLAVGVALADRVPVGDVVLCRSTIRVAPGSYDDRGVLRTTANRNVEGWSTTGTPKKARKKNTKKKAPRTAARSSPAGTTAPTPSPRRHPQGPGA